MNESLARSCDPDQWDALMAERDAVATELDRYGLPREALVADLLRHIYNNRDAAHGAAMLAIDQWKARAEAAEAALAEARKSADELAKALEQIARLRRGTTATAVEIARAALTGESDGE